ncbi:hypothetical protein P8A18_33000 [Streptomyces castrisilvae]|uniref:Uncharacterized protein n=1 Tax=Streptomyces castrisilvae TaxID=3033811 RepID=A0ABY9HTS5_9ACTN|nr:hypothetical protein [Streptomyces sp. Mut1]WLQ37970.1 hypothetical protein P8A18_33000 [Streptomyces sp. Mut1]
MAQADRGNNICGSFTAAVGARLAADVFHSAGWRVRRSGRAEFEVESAYAELGLTPLVPVTFSGFVDPGRIAVLIAALSEMGLSFTIEFEFDDSDGRIHLYQCAGPPSC